jgi:hypothetical protein
MLGSFRPEGGRDVEILERDAGRRIELAPDEDSYRQALER